jgi:DNA-binding beta-propeller fold protein YncE
MKYKLCVLLTVVWVTSFFATAAAAQPGEVIYSFDAPGQNSDPRGIAYDETGLWVCEPLDGIIYKVDGVTGEILDQIPTPDDQTAGLCWHEGYLWATVPPSNMCYKLNPETGDVVWSFYVPQIPDGEYPVPNGVTHDGEYLWVTDDANRLILQIDPESGNLIDSLEIPEDPLVYLYAADGAYDGQHIIQSVILAVYCPWTHIHQVESWYGECLATVDMGCSGEISMEVWAYGVEYDPSDGNLWISDYWDDTIKKIEGFDTAEIINGDINGDGIVNVGDIVYLITYLFRNGAAPQPVLCAADVNADAVVDLGDVVFLINYLYAGGSAPIDTC